MNQQTTAVTYGCLLRGLEVLARRAGIPGEGGSDQKAWPRSSSLWDCLNDPDDSSDPGSPAYIARLASDIASAGCGAEKEGLRPLSPIFTHLNGEHPGFSLPMLPQDGTLRMPQTSGTVSRRDCAALLSQLESQLMNLRPEESRLGPTLTLLEDLTSAVPSGLEGGSDISLYDHVKISAAIGSCISEYLLANGVQDLRSALKEQEAAFRRTDAFLLCSADFSGIQRFIYTVSTKGAMKALRSRSFFLELTMEHYIDELLTLCGMSRANLLYSGGGHCYLLLPNTPAVTEQLERWNLRFNSWLSRQFGAVLYLAQGYTPCSANDLTNTPAREAPYKAMFRRASSAVAKKKLHRYSAQQIIDMNSREQDLSGRECRVCGRTDRLIPGKDGTSLCPWCSTFEKLSSSTRIFPVYLVTDEVEGADFTLPTPDGMAGFVLTNESIARRLAGQRSIRRVYTKNTSVSGLPGSTRIYVGDYAAESVLEDLAQKSSGIRRLGVCRMDVDDLGQSFVAGFEQGQGSDRYKYVTIARTAAFSRQLSLFFKLYINSILSGAFGGRPPLNTAIVYSGGDDMFLVGSWDDTIKAACRIRDAFHQFSCGALTISGGIGVFQDHHPIRLAAAQTADLEEEAKSMPGKDSISLFAPESGNAYRWTDFETSVLGEKEGALNDYLKNDTTELGTAFLYQLLALLRQAEEDPAHRMPLARIAYILARREPPQSSPDHQTYVQFSRNILSWSVRQVDRAQLITAITLYAYRNRKEAKNNGKQ